MDTEWVHRNISLSFIELWQNRHIQINTLSHYIYHEGTYHHIVSNLLFLNTHHCMTLLWKIIETVNNKSMQAFSLTSHNYIFFAGMGP